MRFLFIGKFHGFSLAPLESLARKHTLVALVESSRRGPAAAKQKVEGFRSIAARHQVPYLLLTSSSLSDLAAFARVARPDVICVASLTHILPDDVLAIPRHGAINLHPSALPRYRGAFPWFWQYYNCEPEIGITVHRIEAKVDHGAILGQELVPVTLGTDVRDLMRETEPIGARLMLAAANALERGDAISRPQPPGEYPTARVVRREERLIDWSAWPVDRVWHVMRGTYPWMDAVDYPGGRLGGARWRIGDLDRRPALAAAGRLARDLRGWYVGHREGRIRVHPRLSCGKQLHNVFSGR